MEYEIIQSGSKGNCLVLDNKIMIDCGLSYAKIKDRLKNIKLICLTHIHSDHFLKSTIKKIALEKPTIKFVCGEHLIKPLIDCGARKNNIFALKTDNWYNLGMLKIKIESLFHDVENVCYKIQYKDKKIFYATDTGRIDHIDAENYDYYFIEANYESDEELDEKINKAKENEEYTHLIRVKQTHLSQIQCLDWLYKNRKNNGEYVFMHQSESQVNNDE